MRLTATTTTILSLFLALLISANQVDAQSRRLRIRPRPLIQQDEDDRIDDDSVEDENNQSQYYSSEQRNNNNNNYGQGRVVLVSSDDDYNGVYGQQTSAPQRARLDYNRPAAKSTATTAIPRTKDQGTKAPPVQTIRNYSNVNDDGSFTFGYEAADGSFKEETRGTDCVVRGKYGYIDPDGNKREFTYVSGNPCDPNQPNEEQDEPERPEESSEQENIPQNYPQRPVKPIARPIPTTTPHPPTTVFQNTYSSSSYAPDDDEEEDERPEPIQLLQQQQQHQQQHQQQRPRVTVRPRPLQQIHTAAPEEVTIRQRPRITASTTPAPIAYSTPIRLSPPVSITPRPAYRVSPTAQPVKLKATQPPATTYRPAVQFITQKPPTLSYNTITPSQLTVEPITKQSYASTRKPVDFVSEFQKFQLEHNALQSTTLKPSTQRPFKPSTPIMNVELGNPTSNPIYESQLVFDPSTGQYDSALYQQLPQSDGDLVLNQRIQPYVHQSSPPPPRQFQPSQQLLAFDQLQQQQQQSQQPIFQRTAPALPQPTRSPIQFQTPQFNQQIYHQDQENKNVLNSQQLFAHQQELQQQQLQHDRLEAKRQQQQLHRFNSGAVRQQMPGFYFIQPQESSGQIEAFLRGHNLDVL